MRHGSNDCGSASFFLPRGRLAWCCSLTRDPLQVHNSPSTSPLIGLSLSFRLIYLPLLTCLPRLRTTSRRLQLFYHQKMCTRIVGIRENLDSYSGASNGLFQRSTLGLYGTPHRPLISRSCADDPYGIPHEARGSLFFKDVPSVFPRNRNPRHLFGLCISYLLDGDIPETLVPCIFPIYGTRGSSRSTLHKPFGSGYQELPSPVKRYTYSRKVRPNPSGN